jgi:hypothetical protein
MKNRKALFIKLAIVLAVAVGISIINGCEGQLPVSPADNQNNETIFYGYQDLEQQWGKIVLIDGGTEYETVIDATGGSVDLGDYDSIASFTVPANALDSQVTITSTPSTYLASIGAVYVFEFGPDGLQFNTSAELEFEMSALELYNPNEADFIGADLYLYDVAAESWEIIDTDTDIADGEVDFDIDHFSRYAIGGRTK